jgi:hypothetical protein
MRRSTRLGAACAALLVLAACQDTPIAPLPAPDVPGASAAVQTGWIIGPGDEPMEVRYSVIDGMSILEGDINLGPAGTVAKSRAELVRRAGGPSQGVVINGYRWYNGRVPYTISASFTAAQRQSILDAIAHVQSTTAGTTFVPRAGEADFVSFALSTTACNSPVGKRGGAQVINLTGGCASSRGSTAHEILHSLGVWHEQSRCDRDSFVIINLQNVQPGFEHNFDRKCSGNTDVFGYSEGSVMHYGPWDFSQNGLPTITSRRGLDHLMGQRIGLDQSDVSTVNWMYQPYAVSGINVVDQGGTPLLSWNPLNGGPSYWVNVVVAYEEYDDQLGTSTIYDQSVDGYPLTTATSQLDTQHTYTGTAYCVLWSTWTTTAYNVYYYEIGSGFPDGIAGRTVRLQAPIAPASC